MVNATSLELGFGRGKVEELSQENGPIGVQLFDHRPAPWQMRRDGRKTPGLT